MRLRITLDGHEREVQVEGEPPEVRVSLDGRTVPVRIRIAAESAHAEVGGRTLVLAFGAGLRIDGEARTARIEWLADELAPEGAPRSIEVRPPMPGRVVRILAVVDQSVRRGAPLLILEAMKMQNEIPAPVEGTIREVRVREGDSVAVDDILVRIERR